MEETSAPQEKKSGKSAIIIILVLLLLGGFFLIYSQFNKNNKSYANSNVIQKIDSSSTKSEDTNKKLSVDYIKAVAPDADSNTKIINVSLPDSVIPPEPTYDENAGKYIKKVYSGKRVNICVTGVDARIGTTSKHADANHVISLLLDSGKVEIISIPRDTYVDAGYDDSTGLNKLTILRANRGRQAYLKEVASIAGLDKIHYYVEFGFSQAMGIIDWLGFKDAKSTLQVLRSRQGLGGDDYQRQYNQGNFIKHAMFNHFHKFTGVVGDVMVYGALSLVETNLTHSVMKDLVNRMHEKGFPRNMNDITQKIRPSMGIKFKVYDFSNESVVAELTKKIQNYNDYRHKNDTTFNKSKTRNVENILNNVIAKAESDTAKRPSEVIRKLNIYFEQRAWLQIPERDRRAVVRNKIGDMMFAAYTKKKEPQKAQYVRDIIQAEIKLFEHK